ANELFLDPDWTGYNHDTLYMNGGYAVLDLNAVANAKSQLNAKAVFNYYYARELKTEEAQVDFILDETHYTKFGYYTKNWPGGGYLVTGDTVDGAFHTQDKLLTLGSPVFTGKVTTKDGIKMEGNKWGFGAANPEFKGGYETPVDVPLTLNTTKLKDAGNANGRVFEDPSGNALDLRLEFIDDGTTIGKVKWSKRKTGTSSWSIPVLASLDTLSPNGVIWNTKGDLYLSGTVNGKYTVGTGKKGSSNGIVYLEDDIVYRESPLLFESGGTTVNNPNCSDMLGIVAEKQVVVKNNTANRHDINIHAALFNYDGGITVEGLSAFSPSMGKMRIMGSLTENTAQTTGYTNGAGYKQIIRYDKRYRYSTPPNFPATTTYEIVSWYE
ncbi:MAG: hypothetical protein KDC90_02615, partial [Ignavibacteriae bacterium]|nr:hypothetical protein [Ignavibacteriota bacterium]